MDWAPLAVLVALACALLGCPAHLQGGTTALDRVRIDGNDEVSTSDLEDAIASDPTHKLLGITRMWWVDYGIYDRATVEKDLQRIERYYRAKGYYEAHVRAGRVITTGDREVQVQIVVVEGPIVNVGEVVTKGLEGLPEDVKADVRTAWKAPPGEPFEEDAYKQSGSDAERALTDDGYAYAVVRLGADVDLRKHEATIHVEIVPGPRCKLGPIQVVGLKSLSESKIRQVLQVEQGDDYSTRTLRSAQHALFDLDVFDTVTVEPDLSHGGETIVPIKVTVHEGHLHRVKAGPGFLVDPLRDDAHFTASWEDKNFFGNLRDFTVQVRPLLMIKPGLSDPKEARPGFTSSIDLRQPGFIEGRTAADVNVSTGILPDPINEYRNWGTRGSIGVDRRFGQLVYGGFFYRRGFDLPTAYSGYALPANVFKAQIGYFELLTAIDARDDILKPHSGWYAASSFQYAMASKAFYGGDFGDVRIQPEFRFYGPLGRHVTLAFRFLTGFLFARNYDLHFPNRQAPTAQDPSTYGLDTAGDVPLWRAFFAGGASSDRGYATRQIGLRDCARDVNGNLIESGPSCSQVVGGASVWESSLELRFDIAGDLSGVVFVDAADVSRNVFDIRLDYPHLSTGPGLRYQTPIGPIRMDFGWRIPGAQRLGAPLDPREEPAPFKLGPITGPFALHISIGEMF